MILPSAHTRASIATNENDTTTTKKEDEEDGGSEGGGIVKKHDDYYRRCVYTDGDSEDLTVDDIIQLVKADPNNNKSSSNTTTNVVKEENEKDEGTNNNNDNDGLVMSSNINNNNTSSTSSTVIQQLEWYDITPLTLAVMRGHDDIVEYLLRLGADPTLMGYPKNQLQHPDSNNNNKAHNNIMDAYVAASRLCKMIRRCRRTQDLLLSVKPFWKKASYYGSSVTSASAAVTSSTTTSSSNNNKLRTEYTNVPIHTTWMLRAIDQVPRMVDYPLLCLNYDESMFDIAYWKTKMSDYTKVIKDNKLSSISTTSMNDNDWVEVGQSRRCSSCREYKPVQSYYKNEKKKGTLARCISCVATNPETLDLLLLHNSNNKSSSLLPPISTSHATPVTSSAAAADGNAKICIAQQSTTITTMVKGEVKFELDNNNNYHNNPFQNDDVKRRRVE
jgi:hypothetical protein